MDVDEFLGVNYGDLGFDSTEYNFGLHDSLNSDWLDNIFSSSFGSPFPTITTTTSSSSSCSSSVFLASSSSSSISESSPIPVPDDPETGYETSDSVQHEHSYSIGTGGHGSSTDLDHWTDTTPDDHAGDSFDLLRDFSSTDSGFDLTSALLEEVDPEPQSIIDSEDDPNLDRWLDASICSSSSSPSSSSGSPDELVLPDQPGFKKRIVLFTGEDGQVIQFGSEEPSTNDELVLVDWNYQEQSKDPIDLSVSKTAPAPAVRGKRGGPSSHQSSNPTILVTSFSGSLHRADKQKLRAFSLTEALFLNPPPADGLLLLTDEEKNTLIAEGYPVPTKLPLGKSEEKYLKKIRRKIKNKISAQESRRKKKEYVDQLELKMQKYFQENSELLKKVEQLENCNRLLMGQLQKATRANSAGGTSLMVLVLFFAAFLGSWSHFSWSIGYGRTVSVSGDKSSMAPLTPMSGVQLGAPLPCGLESPVGPDLQHPMIDVYSRISSKSRLLVSTKDEDDAVCETNHSCSAYFGPKVPASYLHTLAFWFNSVTGRSFLPENPKPEVVSVDAMTSTVGFDVSYIWPLSHVINATQFALANQTTPGPLSTSQPLIPILYNKENQQQQTTIFAFTSEI